MVPDQAGYYNRSYHWGEPRTDWNSREARRLAGKVPHWTAQDEENLRRRVRARSGPQR